MDTRTLIFFTLFLISMGFSYPTQASYRAYKHRVEQYDYLGRKRGSRIIQSTLDALQYESLYGGYRWTRVQMLDTWYCPGDTSHKKMCAKPKEPAPRVPASLERPKRNDLPYNMQPVIP